MKTRLLVLFCGLFIPNLLLQAQWSVAHLSQGRSKAFAVTVGHKALFIGGEVQGGGYSNVVDVYNDSTGTWTTLMLDFPTINYFNAPAIVNGKKVFVIQTGETPSHQVNIIDTETDMVSSINLAENCFDVTLGSVDNWVFFTGGCSKIYMYNVETGVWSTSELTVPRIFSVCGTIGHKLFIAGGFTNNGPSNRVDIFDTTTGLWDTASLSVARSMMTVAKVGNDLIFAGGGIPDFVFFDAVDIYHADTDTWSHTTLSQQVFSNTLAGAVAGDKALFTGSVGNPLNVDMYDANTEQWVTLQAPSSHQLNPVVANGNKVFFAGGLNNFSGKVDIYDVSTNTWSNGGALSVPRYYAAGAAIGAKVLIAGGIGNSDVVDIYTLPSSGIPAPGATPMIDLFPNPANDVCIVRFDQPVSGTFMLVSADGRLLRCQFLQAKETLELVTATLPAGLYTWKWMPEAGTRTSAGKILIQH